MTRPSVWDLIRLDANEGVLPHPGERPRRYAVRATVLVLLTPRLRALVTFRMAHAVHRAGLRPMSTWLQGRVLRSSGADIHPAASIGPGLVLMHSAGVVIGDRVVMGTRCHVYQGVTLGDRGLPPYGQPRLGDRVIVGAGAVVMGPVTIGDGAMIGANAVVAIDVPAGHTAVGVPARVLPVIREAHKE